MESWGIMSKKSTSTAKSGGKLAAPLGVVTLLSQFVTPEMLDKTATWLKEKNFSEKFIELVAKIHLPESKNSLENIGYQCDAVEEIILTKSAELADDAPINEWRSELGKIRRGVELIAKSPRTDRKKAKALEQRAKKLFNSVFTAAVN